jgi:hypothetical protein
MEGNYKTGDRIEKEDDFVIFSSDMVGYTIDYIGDDECQFEAIVVWENEPLRNRIVELLNRYGEAD